MTGIATWPLGMSGSSGIRLPCGRSDDDDDAIVVEAHTPLVITEGNYLLLNSVPWNAVRLLFDEVWFVDVEDAVRVPRLIARHIEFGKTPEQAREWVLRSDEANALLVAATRERADATVRLT